MLSDKCKTCKYFAKQQGIGGYCTIMVRVSVDDTMSDKCRYYKGL